MKIIYLHQYFNTPQMNGSTRSYEMARRMVRAGHEVHIITSTRVSSLTSADWVCTEEEGVFVHWLSVPYHNRMRYSARIKAFFKFAYKSATKAKTLKGDLVFASSTPLTIALPAVSAKRKLKVPLIFEVRDLWPELPIAIGALKSPLSKFLAKWLERYAYRNSDSIVGLSPGMSQGVVDTGYPVEKVMTIPNSCDLELFSVPDSAGKGFRDDREWLKDRPLVLYTGTIGHINDVCWLASLAAKVIEIDDSVRFLVIGEGVEEKKLINHAKALGVYGSNFFVEAPLPKSEIPNALNAATICTSLFLPLKEMESNSANKFFDALSAGKPVAINYKGWQKNLLEENDIGIYLNYFDLDSASKRLLSILKSNKKLSSFGKNARAIAEERFSRDKLGNDLLMLLERVGNSNNV